MFSRSVTQFTAKLLAFFVFATTIVVVPFVSDIDDVGAQDFVPWECNGTPILMRGGIFHEVLPDPANPGELIIQAIPGTSGILNSTAHDPITNLIYGVGNFNGSRSVRAYDATGATISDTPITGAYPQNSGAFAGTVLGDGRYIIHSVGGNNATTQAGWFNGARFNLWSIDPATGASTHIGPTPVNFADFAYNPADGFLYQPVNRVLYRVDPNTGAVTTAPTSTVLPNGSFGASWFDASGNLFVFRNSPGDIWRVDPTNPQDVVLVGTPGSNGGTDATNCVSSIDLTKDVLDGPGAAVAPADRIYSPGDTLTYEFTLINNGVPTQNRTVDLCDVLPAGLSYTGTWSSGAAAATLTSGGQAGDTSVCIEADMPSSLFTDPANPGSPPTVITIEVVIDDDAAPGTFENQATLDFDQDGQVDVLSDDIGDSSDPRDPTTIQVLGGFGVSKAVVGHPEDDDADDFEMTITCVAADGSTHDVDADSIVDATTGAPWPGATTNGFTITNGDDVNVVDIPAGTSCTVTETSSTGYTSTVAVLDGGGGGSAPGGTGAVPTGTPAAGTLVNDNCQDGGNNSPFNLQVRHTGPFNATPSNWEMIWRDRPYSTIPGLNPGPYTHTVVPNANGLFDHVFTSTQPLAPFQNVTITGGLPTPAGDNSCATVENFLDPGATTGAGTNDDAGAASDSGELTVDGPIDDEQIEFTNETSTIGIRKITSNSSDLPLDENGTFTFDLTCSNGLDETITVTTVAGVASITYPDTPLIGAGVDCTLSENVPAGWTLTSPNDVAFTTEADGFEGVSFTNDRQVADLTISKDIIGLPEGEDPTALKFEVTVVCTGGFDPDPFATTAGFAVGQPLVVEGLPVGAECTVTETPADGFNIRYSPSQTVVIGEDGSAVDVTNSTGSLIIEKITQVDSEHPIDPTGTFEFLLECTGPGGDFSENFTVDADSLITNGATGGISHSDIGVIATGTTCTVTELPPDDHWTLVGGALVGSAGDGGGATGTGAVPTGTPAAGTLVNDNCQDGGNNSPFNLQVRHTGPFNATPSNWEMIWRDRPYSTIPGLNPGPYTHTVVPNANGLFDHVFTSTQPLAPFQNVTITGGLPTPAGDNSCATVENFLDPGATTGAGTNDGGAAGDIDTSIYEPGPVTFEITEENPEPTASFLNERLVGDLTITKEIEGLPAGIDLGDEPFLVDITCTNGFDPDPYVIANQVVTANTPIVITDLPTWAECTVTEQPDPRFSTTGSPTTVTIDEDGEQVDIVNTTSSFSLDKVTLGSDLTADADGTFGFTVVCTNGGVEVANSTVAITTSAGSGSAVVGDLPLVPPGSTCTVTEVVPFGWTLTDLSGGTPVGDDAIEFITSTDGSAVSFENTLDSATLTLDKDVVGNAVTPELEAETFTVTVECTGNFPGGSYNSGPLTFSEGSPVEIDGLPIGSVCTVTEADDARFTTAYSPAQTITIGPDGAAVTVENETSAFDFNKETNLGDNPSPAEVDATFEFTIECVAPDGTVLFADVVSLTTVDTVAFWDESPFLPPGTACSVTETQLPGWTLLESTTQTITTTSAFNESITFTNIRDLADLTITKAVVGVEEDFSDEPFTVNVSCTGDFASSPFVLNGLTVTANTPVVIPDLPTGAECTVTEDFDSRFDTTYSPANADDSAAVVTITDGDNEAGISNLGGRIAILKQTEGPADHPLGLLTEVEYDLTCSNGFSEVLTLDVDQLSGTSGIGAITFTELPIFPQGTVCTVTEIVPDGWTLTSPNPQTVTITTDPARTEWVNVRDVGSLTVSKVLEGVPAGTDLDDLEFIVDVTCVGGGLTEDPYVIADQVITANTPLVIDNLPTDAICSVDEDADPQFEADTGATVIIDTDGEDIVVTNATSTFSISKTTTGPDGGIVDLDETFSFDIVCTAPDGSVPFDGIQTITTSGQSGTWATPDTPLLPPGTVCSVTEQTPPAGWTNTSGLDVEVTTDSTAVVDAAFVNDRDTDTLTINKSVVGSPTDLSDEDFIVDISCTGGFLVEPHLISGVVITQNTPAAIPDLPTGAACVITERDDPRFLPSYSPDDATVIVGQDGSNLDVDNRTGTFIIEKLVETDSAQPIDLNGTFLIDISCTNGVTQTFTLDVVDGVGVTTTTGEVPLLPDGTGCTVTEQTPPAGWSLTSPNDVVVIVNSLAEPTITFTNTRETADLNISKTVIGAPAGLDVAGIDFVVDVSCSGSFASSPLVFADQVINDGGTITIPDLPTGAVCTVVEDADPRFATTYSDVNAPTTGVEITDAGADVAIVNATGEIMIVKNTQVDSGLPVDLTESFDFLVDCGAAYTGTHTVTTDMVTSATTATGFLRYSDIPALPNGASCVVTEQAAPAGWTLTSPNDVALTVDSAGVVTASFTNERDTGDLTITKTLDGVPVELDLDAELFDITITCVGGFDPDPYIVTGQFSVNAPFVLEDVPTGASCSVVESPDDRFTTTLTADVTIDTDGETVAITNTTSSFSLDKITVASPLVGNPDGSFTFEIECVSPAVDSLFAPTGNTFFETVVITTASNIGSALAADLPLVPPGSTCTVTEIDAAPGFWELTDATGGTFDGDSSVTFTTSTDGTDISFENTLESATLTIEKFVFGSGVTPADLAQTFTITVTCTGNFPGGTYDSGPLTISDGGTVDIPDLPIDAVCTVFEEPDPAFTPTYQYFQPFDTSITIQLDDAGFIPGISANTVGVGNETSTFSIAKEARAPSGVISVATFEFAVECVAPDGSVVYSETVEITTGDVFDDGFSNSSFGEFATGPSLAPGTVCTITEIPLDGWTATSPTVVEVTTEGGSVVEARFENSRDNADLDITKTVIGAPAGLDVPGLTFTVDISCTGDFVNSPWVLNDFPITDGETITIDQLPTGAVCTVVEDADPRFTTTYASADAPTTGVEITDAGADVAILNATGEIMIVKNTTVESGLPVDLTESFDFFVDCGATYSGTHTVTTDMVTSATTATGFLRYSDLPALPAGTDCVVTEQAAPAGWTLTSANDIALTVDSAGVATATFTNERDTGDLTITKTLDGVPAGTDLDAELFDITITCVGGFDPDPYTVTGQFSVDAPFVLEDVPTGAECSVVETPDSRFATATGPDVTLTTTGESIEITNTTSTFAITKETFGPTTNPLDLDDSFIFDITCVNADGTVLHSTVQTITTSGQTGTWATPDTPLLPPGTECSVTELPTTGWTALTTSPQDIVTDSAAIVEAAFENERDTGEVTITKTLDGVPAGTDLDAELFDVTVTCAGDFTSSTYVEDGQISVNAPFTISDLPTGADCSVEEAEDLRFGTSIGSDVIVDTDGESIEIVNSTSTLSITKTTTGPDTQPLDLDDTFLFDVTCTAPDGTARFTGTQSITTSGQLGTWATPDTPLLPPGTVCAITEQTPPAGWTNTTGLDVEVTTDAAGIIDAAFNNERDSGDLTVTKTVLGAPDGIDLSTTLFDVTVTCTNGFTTTDHVVTGQVSATTPLVVPSLPTGSVCEVVEADDARFFTTYNPDDGSGTGALVNIVLGDNQAQIVNSTGAIIVSKDTVVTPDHPVDPVADFTFTIDCGAVYTADHTLTTSLLTPTGANGVIFYTDLPLLPEGTECSVTELDETPEWTLTSDRTVTLTASSDNPVTANFVNERTSGSLAIAKTVESPEGVNLSTEEFEVTVTCSGGFTEDPYVLTGVISEVAGWLIPNLPYGAECGAVETADARFTASYSADAVSISTVPSQIDVLNQTGSFVLDIDSIVNSVNPINPDDDFVFVISGVPPDGTTFEDTITVTTLDGNGVFTSPLYPTGTEITVSLDPSIEWNLIDRDGTLFGDNGIELTIGTDVEAIAFDVERNLSSLTIDKLLENIPFDADFTTEQFTIQVICTNGSETDELIIDGLTVSVVDPLLVVDLPVGEECTVAELADDFFEASFSPNDGTFTVSEVAADNAVSITNTGTDELFDFLESQQPPPPTLAFTGRTAEELVRMALLLMAIGALVLFARRRREEVQI